MLIASVVQLFIYGISLICSSTVSMLIIYFNIQNTGLNSDYLTGVYNRRLIDSYVRERISMLKKRGSFSGMLIDLNKFKSINDRFGHHIGDQALKDFANILRSGLRNDDLIARFGGDEFFVILNKIDDEKILESIAERIKNNVEEFNKTANRVYQLSYSIGYDVYPKMSSISAEEFIEHLDKLMYKDKLLNNM
jgi:diguanylate cyclase (GGDEF)-like protein